MKLRWKKEMDDQHHRPSNIEDGRFDKGFIKTWRSIQHDPIYKDSYAFHLFQHCVIGAARKPKVVILQHGQVVPLERGQLITGREKLHQQTGISENIIRHRLKLLENIGKITTKSTNKFSIITVRNYDQFQGAEDKEAPTDAPTSHQQTTTNKKVEEEGKRNEKKEIKRGISSEVSEEALRLAQLFLESIRECNPDFKPSFDQKDLDRWACDIDLMMRIDKRSPDQIREVITWLKGDSFWWKNIQSGEKLRKQFDRLVAEMRSPIVGRKVRQDGIEKGIQRLKDAFSGQETKRIEHKPGSVF